MPAISVLMKPASGQCNMACEYCFYCDEAAVRQQASYGLMSEETLRNVIRRTMLNATGQISFAFQGGEPSVRGLDFFKKAVELQHKYNRSGLKVHNAFQTNGYAIDEEWCRFFAGQQFLVGLSVDGTRQIHDLYRHDRRGEPTYDRVLRAAELMDRFHVEYNILTVVTAQVAENIGQIYREYQRRGWNYQQYIACLDPLGSERGKAAYSLTPQAYGRFLVTLFEAWYKDWEKGRHPYIRQFENYIGILLGMPPEACDQRGVCGVQCVVEADGSVYPCDFYVLDEYCLGNFNTNKYAEIMEDPRTAAFLERSRRIDPACRECPHYDLCRGGCQRHREEVEGSAFYTNYFCEGFRYFFDHCREKMEHVAETIRRQR